MSCFIPCLDNLKQQLESKFLENSDILSSFQVLLPGFAKKSNVGKLKNLSTYYNCPDSVIKGEYALWCNILENVKQETSFLDVFALCNPDMFRNIHRLFQIFATLPVTTCTVERSFSSMKRVKPVPRNKTSDDRLSDLVVIAIHGRVIKIRPEEVINVMKNKNRRILF